MRPLRLFSVERWELESACDVTQTTLSRESDTWNYNPQHALRAHRLHRLIRLQKLGSGLKLFPNKPSAITTQRDEYRLI